MLEIEHQTSPRCFGAIPLVVSNPNAIPCSPWPQPAGSLVGADDVLRDDLKASADAWLKAVRGGA